MALNFVNNISLDHKSCDDFIFLIPDVGPLATIKQRFPHFQTIVCPSKRPFKRLMFEKFTLFKLYKKYDVKIVYTFFGAGLPHPPNILSLVSVAYPIICYDDSPYWKHVPLKLKIKQTLINNLRISRLKKADKIIVETTIMRDRLQKVLENNKKDYIIQPPAPTDFINYEKSNVLEKRSETVFLFLSGVARHKNLWRLPELASRLSTFNFNFKFLITATESSFVAVLDSSQNEFYLKTKEHFSFCGVLQPDEIQQAYMKSDFLVSLSDLESFSNNYMEAWKVGIPLIVSDRDFSRSICQQSALYIEPHDSDMCSKQIFDFINDFEKIEKNIKHGRELVGLLPTTFQKTKLTLDILSNFK